ncbi:MAG: hypothetical protein M3Q14_02110, partial [bacterium]|nr:hypothetical protein [bacterium]
EKDHPSWKMIAATDSSGGIVDHRGLNASELDAYKRRGAKLVDFKQGKPIVNEDLINLKVDVLVLAALGDVITEANMKQVQATYILELANGPVNEKAYTYLTKSNVTVVPDILANAGGVVVSYLEWLQNRSGKSWTETVVNNKLKRYLTDAVDNTIIYKKQHKVSLKEAALMVAITRLLSTESK